MILDNHILELLHEIRRIEGTVRARALDVPTEQLGQQLIRVYYASQRLKTRLRIREIFERAGSSWVQKLITRDVSEQLPFNLSTLDDYLELAAANDPALEWQHESS